MTQRLAEQIRRTRNRRRSIKCTESTKINQLSYFQGDGIFKNLFIFSIHILSREDTYQRTAGSMNHDEREIFLAKCARDLALQQQQQQQLALQQKQQQQQQQYQRVVNSYTSGGTNFGNLHDHRNLHAMNAMYIQSLVSAPRAPSFSSSSSSSSSFPSPRHHNNMPRPPGPMQLQQQLQLQQQQQQVRLQLKQQRLLEQQRQAPPPSSFLGPRM
jgi:hypothetical protein